MVIFRTLILLLVFTLTIQAQENESPFQDGEWLRYNVKYGWFNTTTATLSVEKKKLEGKEFFHISGKGRTTGLIDVFFKVRDNFQSYLYPDSLEPYKFIRKTYEGGYTKDKAIYFDHQKLEAEVYNYKKDTVSQHTIKNKTQDLISATYYLRNMVDINKLQKGDVFLLNLFFDEENFEFKTVYLGEEAVETKFGSIICLKFKPYVKAGRVFEEKESVTIWVTKDKNKIPIKIKAELAVGSLVARLDAFKGLAHSFKVSQD